MRDGGSTTEFPLRELGRTGLLVHPICIGCAELGDMPKEFAYSVSEEQALAFLRAAFAGPISFLDTAAAYGDGESERRIGLVLRELGGIPPGFVVATKVDRDLATDRFTGDQACRSVERSLRLLGVDHLQLCYLHDPDFSPDDVLAQGGALDSLLRLRDEGVIRHVGLAMGPIDQEIRYLRTGAFEVVITHNQYNLLNRAAEPLLAFASELGIAVVNAAPYGSGILAKGPDVYPRFQYEPAPTRLIECARRLQEACGRYGVPLPAAALQFSLRDPRITSTIVGMTKPERLKQTMELATHPIPSALWSELETLIPSPETGERGLRDD